MAQPTLKKVSNNGQIGLPKIYRDTYVQYEESKDQIILKPMFWDDDCQTWLTKSEYEDLQGDILWSAQKDNENKAIELKNL